MYFNFAELIDAFKYEHLNSSTSTTIQTTTTTTTSSSTTISTAKSSNVKSEFSTAFLTTTKSTTSLKTESSDFTQIVSSKVIKPDNIANESKYLSNSSLILDSLKSRGYVLEKKQIENMQVDQSLTRIKLGDILSIVALVLLILTLVLTLFYLILRIKRFYLESKLCVDQEAKKVFLKCSFI